jgi:hypothetical protein
MRGSIHVKRWVGLGWIGIHQELMLFVCWGIFGGAAVFLFGFVVLFYDDHVVFWLWCRHEQWFFAVNVMILILQCNTYF